jgi:hypothetical protein
LVLTDADITLVFFGLRGLSRHAEPGFGLRWDLNGSELPEFEWNSISSGAAWIRKEMCCFAPKKELAGTQYGVSGQFAYSARPSL